MQNPPLFTVSETSQPGQSLLIWQEPGTTHHNRQHSLQMPTEVAHYLARAGNERPAMLDALQAARVFTSPLQRLKGWNEYKEDAARRINAALGDTP